MSECPLCGLSEVVAYGYRKKRHGFLKKFMCKSCGYIWESESSLVYSVDPRLVEHIRKLMEKAVGDAERGVDVGAGGWIKLDPNVTERLLQVGLCERREDTGEVRISPQLRFMQTWQSLKRQRHFLTCERLRVYYTS